MKTKFIFDLDETLIKSDYSKQQEYFKAVLETEDSEIFIPQISSLLEKYESKYQKYDVNMLSEFLTNTSQVKITPDIIKGWLDVSKNIDGIIIDGVVETLEYLKRKDKELVVLTNWFSKPQIERLKKSGLDTYFNQIFGGDLFLKPSKKAYITACGYTPMELCVMIGDNYQKDYLGSKSIGLDSILYDPTGKSPEVIEKVKSLKKIKERY